MSLIGVIERRVKQLFTSTVHARMDGFVSRRRRYVRSE